MIKDIIRHAIFLKSLNSTTFCKTSQKLDNEHAQNMPFFWTNDYLKIMALK